MTEFFFFIGILSLNFIDIKDSESCLIVVELIAQFADRLNECSLSLLSSSHPSRIVNVV
jgi:hypothetical protein